MKFIVFCFASMLSLTVSVAQSNFTGPSFEPTMPASPDVAKMIQYVNQPVTMSTGTPQINIPIYEINTGLLSLPISLSYHAGGIRVNQDAGNVGLGWTLNAEGVISKQVMGKPDNGSYASSGGLGWTPRFLDKLVNAELAILRGISQYNSIDGIPDLYTFRFGGHSGKFIIPQTGAPILLPQQNLDFSFEANGTWPSGTWKIVDEGGTQYFFAALEKTSDRSGQNITTDNVVWYLTKVRSYNDNDSIVLNYTDTYIESNPGDHFSTMMWWPESADGSVNTTPSGPLSLGQTVRTSVLCQTHGKQLSQIVFTGGIVDYVIEWSRADYAGTTNPRISAVIVRNKSNVIIRAAHFTYDYFNGSSTNFHEKRLRLTQLTVNAASSIGTNNDQVYLFSYNPGALPSKKSFAMDHWGFYNGATGNNTKYTTGTLVPTWTQCTSNFSAPACKDCNDPINHSTRFSGANREPNPAFMEFGVLTQIKYPTGGTRTFEYEPHSIPPASPTYDRLLDTNATVDVVNVGGGDQSSTSFIVTVPNTPLYANGLCATLSAMAIFPTTHPNWPQRGDLWAEHAQCRVIVHEPGSTVPINSQAQISFSHNTPLSGSRTFLLQPGKSYMITAHANWDGFETHGSIDVKFPMTLPSHNRAIGGLRIKKITTHDQYTGKDEHVKYDYNDPATGFSSGQLFKDPTYYNALYNKVFKYRDCPGKDEGPNPPGLCCYFETQGIQLTSSSLDNLYSSSHVLYSCVREIRGGNGEGGYTLNRFTNFDAFNGTFGELDCEWRRGLTTVSETHDAAGVIKTKEIKTYEIYEPNAQQFVGYSATFSGEHPCASVDAATMAAYPAFFNQKMYTFRSEWLRLAADTNYSYLTGGSVKTYNAYSYGNAGHKEITAVETVLTPSLKHYEYRKYPTDYSVTANPSNSNVINAVKALQDKHIHSLPLEVVKAKNAGLGLHYTGAQLLTFKTTPQGRVFPFEKKELMIDASLTSFVSSTVSGTSLSHDSHYSTEASISEQDGRGNILSVSTKKRDGNYLYDYDGLYPVAKGTESSDKISFSSFETSYTGNFAYSQSGNYSADKLTGHRSFNLNASSISIPFQQKPFVLSYWKKGGNVTSLGTPAVSGPTVSGWTYCEHHLTSPPGHPTIFTIEGTALIDELRAFPQNAQMESYNYDPLIGVTSVSDPSGKITFYQYDDLGRLTIVRSQDGNIIRKIDYGVQTAE